MLQSRFVLGILALFQIASSPNSLQAASVEATAELSCEQLLADGNKAGKEQRFEESARLLEAYLRKPDCHASSQDENLIGNLVSSHVKAAGFGYGQFSAVFAQINFSNYSNDGKLADDSDIFQIGRDQLGPVQFSETVLKHLDRAIELHESIEKPSRPDHHLFFLMNFRLCRALYKTLAYPVDGTDIEKLGLAIYEDLFAAQSAIVKVSPASAFDGTEDGALIFQVASVLNANGDAELTEREVRDYLKFYRENAQEDLIEDEVAKRASGANP